MPTPDPVCRSGLAWLREATKDGDPKLHGRKALAPLTGQDKRALAACLHLVELYAVADEEGRSRALQALRFTALCMQAKTRLLAREAVAHVLDWDDRKRFWVAMGFEREEPSRPVDPGDAWDRLEAEVLRRPRVQGFDR